MISLLTPNKKLNENTSIPVLGFGTWGLDKEKEQESIEYALEVGYRHIDTADIYGSHEAIKKALKASGVPREEIFITTKLWKTDLTQNAVTMAFNRFLEELGVSYIDLLLIHRPNKEVPVDETLKAMNDLKDDGDVKAIGVSNFRIDDLKEALETGIEFSNNQVELHPSLNEQELREFCNENGITVTAYSPLARGEDLSLETIQLLAQKYKHDLAQVIINWVIQNDMVAIPKSSNKDHILSNFQSLEWSLSDEDMALIDTIDGNNRLEEK